MLVTTLGDALLDVIVRLQEPLEAGADALAETLTSAGGQAANVAAWVVALGGRARLVAKRGDDAAGHLVAADLERRGIELAGPVGGRNGVVVSLVGQDGDRTMASDRGVSPELVESDLDSEWFACDWLHISGYALLAEPIGTSARRAAMLAREHGARVSVDLSASTRIRAYGPASVRATVAKIEPALVFANEAEWKELGLSETSAAVIKRGALGIRVGDEELPAHQTEVVDATGAGDALAAGYLLGGPALALEAAARCVAKLGAMP